MAIVVGGSIAAAGAIGSSIISSDAAGDAASTQAAGAADATQAQLNMFNTTQANLQPFINSGQSAQASAQTMANTGFSFDPTLNNLMQTPGYKFNLQQGTMAAQNSAAARGLGISGQSAIGAEQYASGLASDTYQQQYQNALTNYQTNFGNQLNLANVGENAAAHLGNNATATGQGISNNIVGAANASGASQIAGANAISSGLNSLGSYGGAAALNGIYGSNSGGSYDAEAAANGLPWSDTRLKKDITYIGDENGYSIYEFSYLWSPERYIGVMAQEIMRKIPDAVRKIGDYFAVDYSKIGVKFRSSNGGH